MELQRLTTVFDGDANQLTITIKKVNEDFDSAQKKAKETEGAIKRTFSEIGSAIKGSVRASYSATSGASPTPSATSRPRGSLPYPSSGGAFRRRSRK